MEKKDSTPPLEEEVDKGADKEDTNHSETEDTVIDVSVSPLQPCEREVSKKNENADKPTVKESPLKTEDAGIDVEKVSVSPLQPCEREVSKKNENADKPTVKESPLKTKDAGIDVEHIFLVPSKSEQPCKTAVPIDEENATRHAAEETVGVITNLAAESLTNTLSDLKQPLTELSSQQRVQALLLQRFFGNQLLPETSDTNDGTETNKEVALPSLQRQRQEITDKLAAMSALSKTNITTNENEGKPILQCLWRVPEKFSSFDDGDQENAQNTSSQVSTSASRVQGFSRCPRSYAIPIGQLQREREAAKKEDDELDTSIVLLGELPSTSRGFTVPGSSMMMTDSSASNTTYYTSSQMLSLDGSTTGQEISVASSDRFMLANSEFSYDIDVEGDLPSTTSNSNSTSNFDVLQEDLGFTSSSSMIVNPGSPKTASSPTLHKLLRILENPSDSEISVGGITPPENQSLNSVPEEECKPPMKNVPKCKRLRKRKRRQPPEKEEFDFKSSRKGKATSGLKIKSAKRRKNEETESDIEDFISSSDSSDSVYHDFTVSGLVDIKAVVCCTYPDCHEVFPTRERYMNHLYSHPKVFVCTECWKIFSSQKDLNLHSLIHMVAKPYQCYFAFCGLRFQTLPELYDHFEVHYSDKMYVCPHCGKRYKRKKSLERHLLLHTGSILNL